MALPNAGRRAQAVCAAQGSSRECRWCWRSSPWPSPSPPSWLRSNANSDGEDVAERSYAMVGPNAYHRGRGGPGYPLLPGTRLGRSGGILPHPLERRRGVARVHGEPRRPHRREPGPSAARPQHPEPGERLQGKQLGRHRNPRERAMGARACLAPRSPGGPRSATRGSCATTASCSARPGTSRGLVRVVGGRATVLVGELAYRPRPERGLLVKPVQVSRV